MDKQTFLAEYNLNESDLLAANITWDELALIAEEYKALELTMRDLGKGRKAVGSRDGRYAGQRQQSDAQGRRHPRTGRSDDNELHHQAVNEHKKTEPSI